MDEDNVAEDHTDIDAASTVIHVAAPSPVHALPMENTSTAPDFIPLPEESPQ